MQLKSLVFSGTLGLATALMPAAASAQDAAGDARGTGTNAAPEIASKCKVITTAVMLPLRKVFSPQVRPPSATFPRPTSASELPAPQIAASSSYFRETHSLQGTS